jgi:hypothetical protein
VLAETGDDEESDTLSDEVVPEYRYVGSGDDIAGVTTGDTFECEGTGNGIIKEGAS